MMSSERKFDCLVVVGIVAVTKYLERIVFVLVDEFLT